MDDANLAYLEREQKRMWSSRSFLAPCLKLEGLRLGYKHAASEEVTSRQPARPYARLNKTGHQYVLICSFLYEVFHFM